MVQGALWYVVVVSVLVVHQSRLQLCSTGKASLVDHLADTTVKALNHPIGLRMPGWCQAVLYALGFALHVKRMVAAWLFGLAGESVCKLTAVVSQKLGDFERSGFGDAAQEIHTADV